MGIDYGDDMVEIEIHSAECAEGGPCEECGPLTRSEHDDRAGVTGLKAPPPNRRVGVLRRLAGAWEWLRCRAYDLTHRHHHRYVISAAKPSQTMNAFGGVGATAVVYTCWCNGPDQLITKMIPGRFTLAELQRAKALGEYRVPPFPGPTEDPRTTVCAVLEDAAIDRDTLAVAEQIVDRLRATGAVA